MAGPRFADRRRNRRDVRDTGPRVARHEWRGGGFCVLPIEVLKDTRLTLRDLRVLIALHAFKDRAGFCWPSRGLLAALTGLPEARISVATTRLAALGWVAKEGNGGRSRSCRYWLSVPESVTGSVTVTDSVTVTKPVTKMVTDSVTRTVTETVRGIEQTMNIPENEPLSCDVQDTQVPRVQGRAVAAAEPEAATYKSEPRAGSLAESSVMGANRGPQAKEGLPAAFERFWSAYPKKRNKGDAWKAWKSLKPDGALVCAILAAVERARESVQWRKDEGQFIPYPATWLRARGWEDEEHVDIVPLPHTRGEKGRIASSVAALQTLFGANDGEADLPAGNGLPRRRLRG